MKECPLTGLWVPDFESLEIERLLLSRVTDIGVALKRCRSLGVAVQAGGHVGVWPRRLIKHFDAVFTFEPEPKLYECLVRNTLYLTGVVAQRVALGAYEGNTQFFTKRGGRSAVGAEADSYDVALATIDSLDLPRCDLLCLDVERSELNVLAGAVTTIRKYDPVVMLEVLGDQEKAIMGWAAKNKYRLSTKVHNDWVFVRGK